MALSEFGQFDLDILGEIGNVSVGGAATSLSNFINKQVTISIPKVKILKFEDIKDTFSPSAILTRIDFAEGLTGSNVMLMKKEEAIHFSQIIVRETLQMEVDEWNEFAKNALQEVFNIMVGKMSEKMEGMFSIPVGINPPTIEEKLSTDIDFGDGDMIAISFDIKLEAEIRLRVLNLLGYEQAHEMIELAKGEYNYQNDQE